GIRLQEQRKASPEEASRLHPLEAPVQRLWLFAGAGWNLGPIQAGDRQLGRAPLQLRRRGRFRRLVSLKDSRHLRRGQERYVPPLHGLLSWLGRLQAWQLARECAGLCQVDRRDGPRSEEHTSELQSRENL